VAYYYNITYNPALAQANKLADNTKQSEVIWLHMITVDRARCSNFVSWDDPHSVECYGGDEYPDIRIGTNGALVQTRDPVICLKIRDAEERRWVTVVRCTGRVLPTRAP
jgi:hypothetical protein